jgi:hypothetical protein
MTTEPEETQNSHRRARWGDRVIMGGGNREELSKKRPKTEVETQRTNIAGITQETNHLIRKI